MIHFHYFKQEWLSTPQARRWQRFHLFWPNGRKKGLGITVWRHEFSVTKSERS